MRKLINEIEAISDVVRVTDEDYNFDKEFYEYDMESLIDTVKSWVL